mmetsp:Transcript_27948/g.83762  ORF Transcript_27948/g.83762 Transcript_27948/m.83762 type:complete len:222 (+) Transcript_27948:149-814(+)
MEPHTNTSHRARRTRRRVRHTRPFCASRGSSARPSPRNRPWHPSDGPHRYLPGIARLRAWILPPHTRGRHSPLIRACTNCRRSHLAARSSATKPRRAARPGIPSRSRNLHSFCLRAQRRDRGPTRCQTPSARPASTAADARRSREGRSARPRGRPRQIQPRPQRRRPSSRHAPTNQFCRHRGCGTGTRPIFQPGPSRGKCARRRFCCTCRATAGPARGRAP